MHKRNTFFWIQNLVCEKSRNVLNKIKNITFEKENVNMLMSFKRLNYKQTSKRLQKRIYSIQSESNLSVQANSFFKEFLECNITINFPHFLFRSTVETDLLHTPKKN